uniref:Uncharacterized protein n=1 Tax=Arundo donax TaxID=35708 RepID=A0A0A9HH39_ARUDO
MNCLPVNPKHWHRVSARYSKTLWCRAWDH